MATTVRAAESRNPLEVTQVASHFLLSKSEHPPPSRKPSRGKSCMNGTYRITFKKTHVPLYSGQRFLSKCALDRQFTALANFEGPWVYLDLAD